MKIITNITDQKKPNFINTDKLDAMQAANKAKGKRTHPVGAYMLVGFIGLIIVAKVSLPELPPAPETPQTTLNAKRTKCFNFLTVVDNAGARQGYERSGIFAKLRACERMYPEQAPMTYEIKIESGHAFDGDFNLKDTWTPTLSLSTPMAKSTTHRAPPRHGKPIGARNVAA